MIASLLVAALGTSLVWLYAQGADQRATQAAQPVRVLHAARAAPVGTRAEALQLETRTIPAAAAEGVLTSITSVQGQALAVPVVAGQQLTAGMFSASPVTEAAQGRTVASISVTGARGVPALLRPGQLVAVYSLTRTGQQVLVVPSTRVVTVGGSTAGDAAGTRAASGRQPAGREETSAEVIGFDVTPEEAVKLLAIEQRGEAALVLLGTGAKAFDPPSSSATP